jgi:tetrathionate reductase subunit B
MKENPNLSHTRNVKGSERENNEKKVRYAMVVDLRRCVGCHSCSVACKVENEVPLSVWRSWVKVIEKGKYPEVRRFFLPYLCNNCERPICVTVCPTKASYQRDDGIVVVNPHKCIGCRYCMASCPYDARHVNPLRHIVQKCFFCSHRVDAGLEPACVETCPAGARIFGNLNDPNSEVARLIATNPVTVLKQQMATYPQVYYIELDMDVADPLKGSEHKWS